MLELPFCPSSQMKVLQWNLNSSLPSAIHLSSLLTTAFRLAFSLTHSLYSSNRDRIRLLLWILRIRLITGFFALSTQPVWKMIRTILLPESPSVSSEIACLIDWCCSRWMGLWNTSPHKVHGYISFRKGKNNWSEVISDSGIGETERLIGSSDEIGFWRDLVEEQGDWIEGLWWVGVLMIFCLLDEKIRLM